MSETQSNLPTLPLEISDSAVVGLSDPARGDWVALRGLQYGDITVVPRSRLLMHGLATMLVLLISFAKVSIIALLAWPVALAVAIGFLMRVNGEVNDALRKGMTRQLFWRHAGAVSGVAMVWCVPILFFGAFGDIEMKLANWTVLAMLVAGSSATYVMIPMTSIVFSAVTGVASILAFLLAGRPEFAILVAMFVAVTTIGAVANSRTHLAARIAEASIAEKSEVVSLLLREFEENEADWLWQVDVNRLVRSISPRFAYALGVDGKKAEGHPLIQLLAGKSWQSGHFVPSLHDLAERMKRRESFSNLIVQVSLPSGERWWELSGTPIIDERGSFTGYRGVGSDVTEQRESDEKIAYLARFDTLTGLPNRRMLTEALGEALRYADQWRARCAFMMIDLDRFKSINDSLGHQVGDRLLEQVALRLKSIMSENEMCGRLGGDEFAVVIRDASDRNVVQGVANEIIQRLSLPYQVDHHTLYVGASVGSAIGPRDGQTVEALMRNADLALYRAKDDGGGVHHNFEPSLYADAEERRQLEFSLRKALERNEFELHFQPVVDTNSEHLVSFEALLRWNSKDHGMVSPAKFIPLAEDTRLIVPIGQWVLVTACREAMKWPSRICVGVNVSVEQLLEPGFADQVARALHETGLPPQRLEVEVTESIFLRDATTAKATLQKIIDLGCRTALDDFGTGYSSLGYLREVRFSTIKVDRSFVQGASSGNAESLAIIRAVVALSDSLELTTTAEGVETVEEAKMIRELGCTKIQGYYYGRPMVASDATGLFAAGNNRVA